MSLRGEARVCVRVSEVRWDLSPLIFPNYMSRAKLSENCALRAHLAEFINDCSWNCPFIFIHPFQLIAWADYFNPRKRESVHKTSIGHRRRKVSCE